MFVVLKKHWKNILIAILVLLLVIETRILWQIPVSFERVNPGSMSQPGSVASEPDSKQPVIKLRIDYTGGFSINGFELIDHKKETLFHALIDTLEQQGNNAPLLIQIDPHVPYQSVAVALDVANRLGLTNISLQTIKP